MTYIFFTPILIIFCIDTNMCFSYEVYKKKTGLIPAFLSVFKYDCQKEQ